RVIIARGAILSSGSHPKLIKGQAELVGIGGFTIELDRRGLRRHVDGSGENARHLSEATLETRPAVFCPDAIDRECDVSVPFCQPDTSNLRRSSHLRHGGASGVEVDAEPPGL